MKKLICCLLALALAGLSSCGGGSEISDTTADNGSSADEGTTSEETTRIYPDVTNIDYGGEDFNIIYFGPGPDNGYSAGFYFGLDYENQSGDILEDSVFLRNRTVAEMLNLNFNYTCHTDGNEMLSAIRSSTMAGDGEYDLLVPYLYVYPNMITENLALDLTQIDSLDLSMPWFDQKSVDELSIMGGLWGVVSDYTIADKMSSICVFFSKQLVEDFGLEDPYKLVLDGDWTFDYMVEKARLVESDLNGNGEMDLEDRYGIMCDVDFSYEMFHAGGYKIAKKNSEDVPELTVYGEREISALQKIYGVMNETMFLNRKRKPQDLTMPQMAQIFANDQVLYFQHIPEALLELRQSTNDFGIIPVPKFDKDQESYYTPVTHYAATFTAIPTMTTDVERSAFVMNLLAAESYYEVMPNLYETVLGVKYVRDDESAQMLDIIFRNRIYDIGNICNFGGVAYKVHAEYYKTPDSFVSKMESLKSSAETAIDKMIDQINDNMK